MSQKEIDELESSLLEQSARQDEILRTRVHCGMPLVERRDPAGRALVHIGCAAGIEVCPEHFLIALEPELLKEIRNEPCA
jgi:hypothetical protein